MGAPRGAHRTTSLFRVASELAALQVALRDSSSTEGRDYQWIRTFAWNVETGERVFETSEWPELAVFGDSAAIGLTHVPYPRITRYRVDGRERTHRAWTGEACMTTRRHSTFGQPP